MNGFHWHLFARVCAFWRTFQDRHDIHTDCAYLWKNIGCGVDFNEVLAPHVAAGKCGLVFIATEPTSMLIRLPAC